MTPLSRRRRWRRLTNRIGWWVGPLAVRLLVKSWRIRAVDRELLEQAHGADRAPVIAFWHQQILPAVGSHVGFPVEVLMSNHRDGRLIARIAGKLGFGTIVGSSSSGAAEGMRNMMRAASKHKALALTPDGPRGPAFQFAPGVFFLAAMLGRPLVATGYGASSYWQARSWDRMVIPKPFARVTVAYASIPEVPRSAAKPGPEQDAMAASMKAAMDEAKAKAEAGLRGECDTVPRPAAPGGRPA